METSAMAEADLQADRTAGRPAYSAPALEKGFDVVELLATEPQGLTISEIAAKLGLSISQIFRMIVVMERRGWLYKDGATDRYRVSYKVLELAYRATPLQELATVATPVMYSLAHASQQSCHLVVRADAKALVVQRQESPSPTVFTVRLGTTVDLAATCSGHVLLAFAKREILGQILPALTLPARLSGAALKTTLQTVRERGYESLANARVSGVRDISFPVFGFDGNIAAALTVPFLTLMDGTQSVDFEGMKEMLGDAAHRISQGLGYRSAPGSDDPPMP
jgi:DNA-binding IclR family transcriptional regulator